MGGFVNSLGGATLEDKLNLLHHLREQFPEMDDDLHAALNVPLPGRIQTIDFMLRGAINRCFAMAPAPQRKIGNPTPPRETLEQREDFALRATALALGGMKDHSWEALGRSSGMPASKIRQWTWGRVFTAFRKWG